MPGDPPLSEVAKRVHALEHPLIYAFDEIAGRKLVFYIQKVIDERRDDTGCAEYLVEFYGSRRASWHTESDMLSCGTLIDAFHSGPQLETPATSDTAASATPIEIAASLVAEDAPAPSPPREGPTAMDEEDIEDQAMAPNAVTTGDTSDAISPPAPAPADDAAKGRTPRPLVDYPESSLDETEDDPPPNVGEAEAEPAAPSSSSSGDVQPAAAAPPEAGHEPAPAPPQPASAAAERPAATAAASPAAAAAPAPPTTSPLTTHMAGGRHAGADASDAIASAAPSILRGSPARSGARARSSAARGVSAAGGRDPLRSLSSEELVEAAAAHIRRRESALDEAHARQEAAAQQVRLECAEWADDDDLSGHATAWLATLHAVRAQVDACRQRVERETQPLRSMLEAYGHARETAKKRRLEASAASQALEAAAASAEAAAAAEAESVRSVEAKVVATAAEVDVTLSDCE